MRCNGVYMKLKLRVFDEYGDGMDELARVVGKSRSYVADRMRGEHPWDAEDMVKLGEHYDIPHERFFEFFCEKKPDGRKNLRLA